MSLSPSRRQFVRTAAQGLALAGLYAGVLPASHAAKLVDMFIANFEKFEDQVDGSVRDAAPGLKVAAE